MASSGLLAGLQGYESVAAAPGKAFGEGIVGAVDQGIGAYTAVSRVRQGEEEGARSQQRLDMAQALQPGQLREQQLNLDAKGLAITEAGRRVERQKRQEVAGAAMRARVESGWYKDNPEDYKMDILNFTMIGENHADIQAAFKDYNMAVVQKGETADQLNRITSGYHAAHQEANAHTGPDAYNSQIRTWADFISRHQKENPIGAAASPEFKHAHVILNKLVDEIQPRPIKDGYDKYTQARASDNKMSAVQAWHAAQVGMDPQQIARMNTMLKPADVKAEEEAARKGGDEAALEAVRAPGKLAVIKATGEEQRENTKLHNQGLIDLERLKQERDRTDKAQQSRDAKEAAQEKALTQIEDFRMGRGEELTQTQVNALRKNAGVVQVADPSIDTEYKKMKADRAKARQPESTGPGLLDRALSTIGLGPSLKPSLKQSRDQAVSKLFPQKTWGQLTPAEKEQVASTIK